MQNSFDFSPLFRSTVGFDRLSRLLESNLLDQQSAYPPYNIVKESEDNYRITMAVAGFTEKDLEIISKDNQLFVSGKSVDTNKQDGVTYLHRGIAERAFERRFQLADHIKVADVVLENGLLTIHLVREVPEEMKPRRIEIKTAQSSTPMIEGEKKMASK